MIRALWLSVVSLVLACPSVVWWVIKGSPPIVYLIFSVGVVLGWIILNVVKYFETKRSRTIKAFLILCALVQVETALFWYGTKTFPTGMAVFNSGLLTAIVPWLIQVSPTLWFKKADNKHIVQEDFLGQYVKIGNDLIRPEYRSLIKTGSGVTVKSISGDIYKVTKNNYIEEWINHGPDVENESQSDKIQRFRITNRRS